MVVISDSSEVVILLEETKRKREKEEKEEKEEKGRKNEGKWLRKKKESVGSVLAQIVLQ